MSCRGYVFRDSLHPPHSSFRTEVDSKLFYETTTLPSEGKLVLEKTKQSFLHWVVRESGAVHGALNPRADPRLNGMPVFFDQKVVGMVLCTSWFDTPLTFVPADVWCVQELKVITPVRINHRGHVKHSLHQLTYPAEFREVDLQAEQGRLASLDCVGGKKLTAVEGVGVPTHPAVDRCIHAFHCVFVERAGGALDCVRDQSPGRRCELEQGPRRVARIGEDSPPTFDLLVQAVLKNEGVEIQWSDGDVEVLHPQECRRGGIKLTTMASTWNVFTVGPEVKETELVVEPEPPCVEEFED